MATFAELLKLADRIKDAKLKKLVVQTLKSPGDARNPHFRKYKAASMKDTPASIAWHHIDNGGLLEHTYSVTSLAIAIGESLQKTYKTNLDMDSLIAAALVHDIGKLYLTKKGKAGWENAECLLDHTMLGTSELYARGFPEKVVHIVASHFGEKGPTPPQTIEAIVFHTIDHMDAILGTQSPQDEILRALGLA
jgi:7,8-dihydroneopterin 2',3'-cyclic phosphate phosphodiesterase